MSAIHRRNLSGWALLALLAFIAPWIATAAGLGKLVVLSTLGQPLNAEIELLSVQKGETITARLASQEVYQQAGVQFNNALTGARVTVEKRPNGQLYLKATTPRPINEPFIELVIEMNSEHGRVVRQYTALLDPPGYGRAAGEVPPPRTTAAESAPPPPVTASPAPAPRVAEAPLAPPVQKPATSRQRPAVSTGDKQYGPVKPGETLSGIARNVRPEGVTLEQTLVSLYQRNPEAFINRNMNLIRSGKILRVPEPQEMAAVTRSEAAEEVRVQVADFNAYRNRVADRAVSVPEAGSVRSGRIEPRVAERDATEAPRDRVRVSRGEPPGKAADAATNVADRVRALEEEVIARDKALAEANERIAQLERIIKDTQRAIELKSSTMAAAQQAAEKAAPSSQAEAASATPAPKAAEQSSPSEAPPAATAEAPKGAEVGQQPAPKPQASAAPEPAPQPDIISTIMDEPLYLAAGAVVVLGGIGFVLVRRRRAAERGWPHDQDESIGKIAPTIGSEARPEQEPEANLESAPERTVPRAPAERPRPVPAEAMAGIVAALSDTQAQAGGEDNDLDFHGEGERASARQGIPPAAAADIAAREAQIPGTSKPDQPQHRAAEPPRARSPGSTSAPKAAEPALPDFLLNERPVTPGAGQPTPQTGAPAQKVDFDLEPLPPIHTPAAPAGTRPKLDFKLDLDDLDVNAPAQRAGDAGRDDHWHDVQQKFDLAKAYEDMGDKQGARDILQEVIREGDTEQQVQARRRLESLT